MPPDTIPDDPVTHAQGPDDEEEEEDEDPDASCEDDPCGCDAEPRSLERAAFHQALRHQLDTGGTATLRMRLPLVVDAERLAVTFGAGDGALTLLEASVAPVSPEGALLAESTALTFDGEAGFEASSRALVRSDWIDYEEATEGDELAVTFVVDGALAASAIANFDGSRAARGDLGDDPGAFGQSHPRIAGVSTVWTSEDRCVAEGDATRDRVAIALGDSITEGYVEGPVTAGPQLEDGFVTAVDDFRDAWTHVAEKSLGFPVLNAAVSGQGTYGALAHLEQEVLSVDGLSDCVVLLGTNDIAGMDNDGLIARLSELYDRLEPHCDVWAATLTPRELFTGGSDPDAVRAQQRELNDWIRENAPGGRYIDFAAATSREDDPDRFKEGYEIDGLHPSIEGHWAMGQAAAEALSSSGQPGDESAD